MWTVTKLIQLKKGLIGIDGEKERERERERERVLKEEEFIPNKCPICHETQYMYVCF